MQGSVGLSDEEIGNIQPWLRVTTGICASWAGIATIMGSPWAIWALVPFAMLGAALPNHAFDAIYNVVFRRMSGGPPIPRSGAPRRFACSVAAAWLALTGAAFYGGVAPLGYALGASLAVGASVPTLTHFCIPSFICGRVRGFRARRATNADDAVIHLSTQRAIPTGRLRLLCILAHPDDETLGFGGVLAKYAREGVETHVITATRGEKGWFGPQDDYPGPRALGRMREQELRAAVQVLGVESLTVLDYIDGELSEADPNEVIAKLADTIRRIRPTVIVTFGHDGIYGHPDHIAISQFATAAVVAAADASNGASATPHRVDKLYYRAPSVAYMSLYEQGFGELVMEVNGDERRTVGWADWLITTRVDAREHWRQVWDAVQKHHTQLPGYERLAALSDEHHELMWGTQEFYRAFSLVGAPSHETDLFAGSRAASPPARATSVATASAA